MIHIYIHCIESTLSVEFIKNSHKVQSVTLYLLVCFLCVCVLVCTSSCAVSSRCSHTRRESNTLFHCNRKIAFVGLFCIYITIYSTCDAHTSEVSSPKIDKQTQYSSWQGANQQQTLLSSIGAWREHISANVSICYVYLYRCENVWEF